MRPLAELQRSNEAQSATVVHLQACLSLSVFRRKLSRNELIIPAGLLFLTSVHHMFILTMRAKEGQCVSADLSGGVLIADLDLFSFFFF